MSRNVDPDTAILLVRHGQTSLNVTGHCMGRYDEDLDEVGHIQAHRLSAKLAAFPITSVYTSPLRRARTTAAILAEPHKLELNVLNDLVELGVGDWEGLHPDEIRRGWPGLYRQLSTDPSGLTIPSGESFPQATERAIRALHLVLSADRGKQVLMVTHEVIIKILVAHALGVSNSIYPRLEIGNGSLTVVKFSNNGCRLVTLNDTSLP